MRILSFGSMSYWTLICFFWVTLWVDTSGASSLSRGNHSFGIDYERNTFVKDGEPFRYISGSVHYFRLMEQYWDDVLNKMKLAGLNAVTTYLEWGSHQPTPAADYKFEGNLNIFKFLELAQKNGLVVILRSGPFIDAERDMGGLPPWLLWQKENMQLRVSDLEFGYFVSRWFDYILPLLKPYLYQNGGPIITVQVENEYGSYGCDKNYTSFLRDLIRFHLGEEVVLFTTDGSGDSYLKCGAIPNVYPTVDFGPGSAVSTVSAFAVQRRFAPKGPLVNSEFYPGWLDHWQSPHSKVSAEAVTRTLDQILGLNANVNIYMFYGGTSFGFGAGSNADSTSFAPCPTSYDYDAPLSEARDPTAKYFAIKRTIAQHVPVPTKNPEVPGKGSLGKIYLEPFTSVICPEFLLIFGQRGVQSLLPLSFEELKVGSGFVLYETQVNFLTTDPALLQTPNLKDRAYVFVGDEFVGILSRSENVKTLSIFVQKGQQLKILVENQGRPCYGHTIGESKGLGLGVSLDGTVLQNWTMYKLGDLNGTMLSKYAHSLRVKVNQTEVKGPIINLSRSQLERGAGLFYTGKFTLTNSTILDTFVRFDGWTKGFIWVNGFNLGRYWPVVGPQETLYLPAPLLRKGENSVIIFELERSPSSCDSPADTSLSSKKCFISFTDTHVIDAPTPKSSSLTINRKWQMPEVEIQLESSLEQENGTTFSIPPPTLPMFRGVPQINLKSSSRFRQQI